MLRKITTLLAMLTFLGSMLASAMFFDDNPRYIQVDRDDTTESYIDMNSIQNIRYDPPYYIIRATVITYDYTTNIATGYENNYFYNFKRQTVKAQTIATCVYDEYGVPSPFMPIANPTVSPADPVNSIAADNAFFSCYNVKFYHTSTN